MNSTLAQREAQGSLLNREGRVSSAICGKAGATTFFSKELTQTGARYVYLFGDAGTALALRANLARNAIRTSAYLLA
jgi:hypothetical protein